MAFVELDGVRIRHELTGDPGLPVLVLSHALGVDLTIWELQLAALASHVRVLRYDTRGHGGSSVVEGPYTAAGLGRDVLALLDALGIEQASFCGLSMGGIVGQWLGIHAQDRIRRLVLANTAAKIGSEEAWNSRIETVLRDGLDPIIPGTLERWFTAPFRAAEPETIVHTAALLRATSTKGYAACCAAIRDADFRSGIKRIKIPSLIIAGREDPVTSIEDGAFLAEAIADSTFIDLTAAHLSNVEAASAFNAALISFLQA